MTQELTLSLLPTIVSELGHPQMRPNTLVPLGEIFFYKFNLDAFPEMPLTGSGITSVMLGLTDKVKSMKRYTCIEPNDLVVLKDDLLGACKSIGKKIDLKRGEATGRVREVLSHVYCKTIIPSKGGNITIEGDSS